MYIRHSPLPELLNYLNWWGNSEWLSMIKIFENESEKSFIHLIIYFSYLINYWLFKGCLYFWSVVKRVSHYFWRNCGKVHHQRGLRAHMLIHKIWPASLIVFLHRRVFMPGSMRQLPRMADAVRDAITEQGKADDVIFYPRPKLKEKRVVPLLSQCLLQ